MPKVKLLNKDSNEVTNPGEAEYVVYYCPGCDCLHNVIAKRWHWNEEVDSPTLSPSVRHHYRDPDTERDVTVCHYFIKDGQIEFCNDCPHEKRGQRVNIEDVTQWEGRFNFVGRIEDQ